MKKVIIAIIVIALVGFIIYFISTSSNSVTLNNQKVATTTLDIATTTKAENKVETILGKSVEGKDIVAYHFGTGEKEILFVGGIHGGYEWNTTLLAYELTDYLKANPNTIPTSVKVTVIPVLASVPNTESATVPGRFNANNVDLNRNFDCDWQTTATWQNKAVSGGNAVFSEPESLAVKNYIEAKNPKAVIVYYSAAGGVFSSNCHNGVLPETNSLTNTYAKASGYPAYEEFNFYEITGDMVNWLAKKNIPSISVLLTNHKDTEWTKNLAGVKAILNFYAK